MPWMQTEPRIGLNLPMQVLVWQDDEGQVHVIWSSANYLIARHGLDERQGQPLAAIRGLIEAALR